MKSQNFTRFLLVTALILYSLLPITLHSQITQPEGRFNPAASSQVVLNLPNNTIDDVLEYYSTLTGVRYVRDANLAGPNLRIVVPTPVPREEAIRIIEASLNLNGYSLVPFGPDTMKVINNAARNPRSQGIPILTDLSLAPPGEPVVSLFTPLRYITPEDAVTIIQQQLPFNPQYGAMIPVKNAQAILATETVSYLNNLQVLLTLIDVPPSPITSEFVQLIHADAEQVSQTVSEILNEQAQTGGTPFPLGMPGQPGMMMNTAMGMVPPGSQGSSGIKLISDKRTNRILVMCRPPQFKYVRNLIKQFDQPTDLTKPFERFLQYISAAEVLPVIQDLLSDDPTGAQGGSGGGGTANPGFRTGGSQTITGGSGGASNLSIGESLADPAEDNSPESIVIGKTRIVANKRGNSIIVFGSPENIAKVQTLIDILDTRPLQVYISTVIGQLAVGDGMTTALDIFRKYGRVNNDFQFAAGMRNRTGPVPLIPDLNDATKFPNLAGFTFYGVLFDFIETYVQLLESTNRFRVTSRPTIFTANNKKATILSGEEVPVPRSTQSVINPGTQPGTNLGVTSDIDYKDVVLRLDIVPLINANREVTLDIVQRNDNIVGSSTISGITVPNIGTQQIKTSVTVPNRSTVVLGGLIKEERERNLSGVPLLSRIPVLGYLFRNTQDRKDRSELVILMQPTVIDSHETYEAQKVRELDRYQIAPDAWENANPGTRQYVQEQQRLIREQNREQSASRTANNPLIQGSRNTRTAPTTQQAGQPTTPSVRTIRVEHARPVRTSSTGQRTTPPPNTLTNSEDSQSVVSTSSTNIRKIGGITVQALEQPNSTTPSGPLKP